MKLNGKVASDYVKLVLERIGVSLNQTQWGILEQYVSLLLDQNKKVNLISRRDEHRVWVAHILHSLLPLAVVRMAPASCILDIGTGGGLPGLPIAIAEPNVHVILCDSMRKKADAVTHIVAHLPVTNLEVWSGRAEQFSVEYRGLQRPSAAVARSVAPLCDLVRWASSAVSLRGTSYEITTKSHGRLALESPLLLAMKGGEVEQEIRDMQVKQRTRRVTVVSLSDLVRTSVELEDKKMVVVQL